jgi:hypothetical protein
MTVCRLLEGWGGGAVLTGERKRRCSSGRHGCKADLHTKLDAPILSPNQQSRVLWQELGLHVNTPCTFRRFRVGKMALPPEAGCSPITIVSSCFPCYTRGELCVVLRENLRPPPTRDSSALPLAWTTQPGPANHRGWSKTRRDRCGQMSRSESDETPPVFGAATPRSVALHRLRPSS